MVDAERAALSRPRWAEQWGRMCHSVVKRRLTVRGDRRPPRSACLPLCAAQGGPPQFIAESHCVVESSKNFSLKQRAGRNQRDCREEQGSKGADAAITEPTAQPSLRLVNMWKRFQNPSSLSSLCSSQERWHALAQAGCHITPAGRGCAGRGPSCLVMIVLYVVVSSRA
jgi:hypothetical protein